MRIPGPAVATRPGALALVSGGLHRPRGGTGYGATVVARATRSVLIVGNRKWSSPQRADPAVLALPCTSIRCRHHRSGWRPSDPSPHSQVRGRPQVKRTLRMQTDANRAIGHTFAYTGSKSPRHHSNRRATSQIVKARNYRAFTSGRRNALRDEQKAPANGRSARNDRRRAPARPPPATNVPACPWPPEGRGPR